jgi:hypothetical protein
VLALKSESASGRRACSTFVAARTVAFILELLASRGTREEILKAYPQVTPDGLEAALRYAADTLEHEEVWESRIPA